MGRFRGGAKRILYPVKKNLNLIDEGDIRISMRSGNRSRDCRDEGVGRTGRDTRGLTSSISGLCSCSGGGSCEAGRTTGSRRGHFQRVIERSTT
jgi:hypothetical protein